MTHCNPARSTLRNLS